MAENKQEKKTNVGAEENVKTLYREILQENTVHL